MYPDDSKCTKEVFTSDVQAKILSGNLRAGQRLPSERELAESYGISRGAVAQGMEELEKHGFIRIVPRKGAFVADFKENATLETLTAIMMHDYDAVESSLFRDLMDLRILVERECTRLVCERLNSAAVTEISERLDAVFAAENDIGNALYEFHLSLVRLSGNSAYYMVFKSFENMLRLMIRLRYADKREAQRCLSPYATLASAIIRGDAEEACAHMKSILSQSAAYLCGMLKDRERKDKDIEIERRFLIAMPNEDFLSKCSRSQIAQTYLLGEKGSTERVRMRIDGDECRCTHTVKRRLGDIRREEKEREISRVEYESLLQRADPSRRMIEKSRFCYEYEGQLLEIDVFPFWQDRAILEIELSDEAQSVSIPPELKVYREISTDKRYTNASLALQVPYDEL